MGPDTTPTKESTVPEVTAYAVSSPTSAFEKVTITRREPGPTEVFFDVVYAGICHSDIHTARGEWGQALYPLVPGHELAGVGPNSSSATGLPSDTSLSYVPQAFSSSGFSSSLRYLSMPTMST